MNRTNGVPRGDPRWRLGLGACVLLLSLLPGKARADRHDMDAYAAFSWAKGSNLWGADATYAFFPFKDKAAPEAPASATDTAKTLETPAVTVRPSHRHWSKQPYSIPLDVSYQSGSHDGDPRTRLSVLTGLRRTLPDRDPCPAPPAKCFKGEPFAQVLIGGVWAEREGEKDGAWTYGVGAGVDLLFSEYGGVRVQTDLLWSKRDAGPVPRISVGVVYRFED